MQAFDTASTFAAAYSIGKAEASAALNLLKKVPPDVRDKLQGLVRTAAATQVISHDAADSIVCARNFSMGKFLHHEPVANGVFNVGYGSGVGTLVAWEAALQNTTELLNLMCVRLERDWVSLAPKMRRAWGLKECATRFQIAKIIFRLKLSQIGACVPVCLAKENLQKVCGAYLACVQQFQSVVSNAFADSALKEINETFKTYTKAKTSK